MKHMWLFSLLCCVLGTTLPRDNHAIHIQSPPDTSAVLAHVKILADQNFLPLLKNVVANHSKALELMNLADFSTMSKIGTLLDMDSFAGVLKTPIPEDVKRVIDMIDPSIFAKVNHAKTLYNTFTSSHSAIADSLTKFDIQEVTKSLGQGILPSKFTDFVSKPDTVISGFVENTINNMLPATKPSKPMDTIENMQSVMNNPLLMSAVDKFLNTGGLRNTTEAWMKNLDSTAKILQTVATDSKNLLERFDIVEQAKSIIRNKDLISRLTNGVSKPLATVQNIFKENNLTSVLKQLGSNEKLVGAVKSVLGNNQHVNKIIDVATNSKLHGFIENIVKNNFNLGKLAKLFPDPWNKMADFLLRPNLFDRLKKIISNRINIDQVFNRFKENHENDPDMESIKKNVNIISKYTSNLPEGAKNLLKNAFKKLKNVNPLNELFKKGKTLLQSKLLQHVDKKFINLIAELPKNDIVDVAKKVVNVSSILHNQDWSLLNKKVNELKNNLSGAQQIVQLLLKPDRMTTLKNVVSILKEPETFEYLISIVMSKFPKTLSSNIHKRNANMMANLIDAVKNSNIINALKNAIDPATGEIDSGWAHQNEKLLIDNTDLLKSLAENSESLTVMDTLLNNNEAAKQFAAKFRNEPQQLDNMIENADDITNVVSSMTNPESVNVLTDLLEHTSSLEQMAQLLLDADLIDKAMAYASSDNQVVPTIIHTIANPNILKSLVEFMCNPHLTDNVNEIIDLQLPIIENELETNKGKISTIVKNLADPNVLLEIMDLISPDNMKKTSEYLEGAEQENSVPAEYSLTVDQLPDIMERLEQIAKIFEEYESTSTTESPTTVNSKPSSPMPRVEEKPYTGCDTTTESTTSKATEPTTTEMDTTEASSTTTESTDTTTDVPTTTDKVTDPTTSEPNETTTVDTSIETTTNDLTTTDSSMETTTSESTTTDTSTETTTAVDTSTTTDDMSTKITTEEIPSTSATDSTTTTNDTSTESTTLETSSTLTTDLTTTDASETTMSKNRKHDSPPPPGPNPTSPPFPWPPHFEFFDQVPWSEWIEGGGHTWPAGTPWPQNFPWKRTPKWSGTPPASGFLWPSWFPWPSGFTWPGGFSWPGGLSGSGGFSFFGSFSWPSGFSWPGGGWSWPSGWSWSWADWSWPAGWSWPEGFSWPFDDEKEWPGISKVKSDKFEWPTGYEHYKNFNWPSGFDLPIGFKCKKGFKLPGGFKIPEGFKLPNGFKLPSDLKLPEGFALPEGITFDEGFQLPKGFALPENFSLPQDFIWPEGYLYYTTTTSSTTEMTTTVEVDSTTSAVSSDKNDPKTTTTDGIASESTTAITDTKSTTTDAIKPEDTTTESVVPSTTTEKATTSPDSCKLMNKKMLREISEYLAVQMETRFADNLPAQPSDITDEIKNLLKEYPVM